MKMPIFASIIVFVIWLAYEIKKHNKMGEKAQKNFWQKEAEANNTRRKPLDALDYISIPDFLLSLNVLPDDEKVQEDLYLLSTLNNQKIVNLTGFTNTELKLKYGAPNLTLLMEYDQNYTLLVRTLQHLSTALYDAGHVNDARVILEFAVSTKTDVSRSYFLLASIYKKEGTPEKIEHLIQVASSLQSAMKNTIVQTLQEFDQCND